MGKKAKKRQQRNESNESGYPQSLEPNEFEGKLMGYVESPDHQLIFMDPSWPVFVFSNEKTGEMATIGDRQGCFKARQAIERGIAEELLTAKKKKGRS